MASCAMYWKSADVILLLWYKPIFVVSTEVSPDQKIKIITVWRF